MKTWFCHYLSKIFSKSESASLPDPPPEKEQNDRVFVQVFITNIFVEGDVMDSKYKISGGQIGAVGDNAHAQNFTQVANSTVEKIDLPALSQELETLIVELKKQASEPADFEDLSKVVAAKKAADAGDGSGALEHLKKVGAWVWKAVGVIGAGVAIAAAKKALGL